MNYQQFVSAVEMQIKQSVKEGVEACIHTTVKNNGRKRIGITVMEKGVNISPTIYLEEYYEQFKKNKSLDSIVRNILDLYSEVRLGHSWEVEGIQNYERAKKKIVFKLINAEENECILREMPHILYLDLAIVFCVLVDVNSAGTATILVTKEIEKMWGTDCEELYRAAKENTKRLLPPEFQTMRTIIEEMIGGNMGEDSGEDCMYVLSNDIRSFGAACILYEDVLEKIGDELQENFYVLPSSIHEVIIIPESKSPNRIELEEMIEEINDTQVEQEEILSDKAYYFSRKENRLIL